MEMAILRACFHAATPRVLEETGHKYVPYDSAGIRTPTGHSISKDSEMLKCATEIANHMKLIQVRPIPAAIFCSLPLESPPSTDTELTGAEE